MIRPAPLDRPYPGTRTFMVDGDWRVLEGPDGPPTGRQLLVLWHQGALALAVSDPDNKFTKAQAAWAISQFKERPA
jgi:hypothetical protein